MQPFFIDSRSGPLFAVYWKNPAQPLDKVILHVPAFAEEMNKSRRMVTLQANAFVQRGYSVLVPDLFGTGDSVGDYGEATWQIWLDNLTDAIAWLRALGNQTVTLWGLRAGVLLALDYIHQYPGSIEDVIAWQPVLNGDAFVTQVLRLRVAAAAMKNAGPSEKTKDLKQALQNRQSLEVAGYKLHPDLINPLATLQVESFNLQSLKKLIIFEVAAAQDGGASLGVQKFIQAFQDQAIDFLPFTGECFWATQEITTAPNLIQSTTDRYCR